jgi:hypothetical protein
MIPRFLLLCSLAMVLSQCADQGKDEGMAAAEAAKPRSMNERFNGRGKEGYYQDGEGNWKVRNDKRSSFERQGQASMANQQYSGKAYQAGSVQKQSWWGNTQYQAQAYGGNTSADHWRTPAAVAGQKAPEAASRSLFSRKSVTTTTLDRKSALEGSRAGVNAGTSANEARRAFNEPDIIDWKEQRALQIKDTKSWLRK